MIDETYAGIKPKSNFKQDPETGISNIESASAAIYGIYPWRFYKTSSTVDNPELLEPDNFQK